MSVTAFFGLIEVSTDNDTVTYSESDSQLTAGSYYLYSPVNADSLLYLLSTELSTILGTTVVVSFNSSYLLQIVCSASRSFTFDLQETLGFDSGTLSGTTITATSHCVHKWIPSRPVSSLDTPTNTQGLMESFNSQRVTNDGDVYTQMFGDSIQQTFTFRYLLRDETFGSGNTLESFWGNVLRYGTEFLAIMDYADNNYYFAYVAKLDEINKFAVKAEGKTSMFWKFEFAAWGV